MSISAYSARKRSTMASAEHMLVKITHQARFILMIIDNEFKIAKRRSADLMADLKQLEFEP